MGLKVSSKRFVLSDETKNLYGFITRTDGIDMSAFDDNRVMLYNHDYDKLIGQWVDWKKENGQLTAAPGFDEDDAYAMQQYKKVEAGILKGASVGISPIQFDELSGEMVSCLLLEASLTPVPNNKKALAIYNANGKKLNASEVTQYLLSVERTDTPITKNQEMKKELILALVALCAQAGHTIELSAESKDEDFTGAIKAVEKTVKTLQKAKTDLSAQVTELEKANKDAVEKEIDDALTAAVDAKSITADQVKDLKAFGLVNLSAFKTTLAALKPSNVVTLPGKKDDEDKTDLSGDKATWTYDDFALKAPAELAELETKNPEKFKVLLNAKLDSVRKEHTINA